ncbi:Pleckstrin homology domain-containing protein [Hysterangium stoloniferum]|nr:Pleckstrin homology domain-containing protein [Hysterangium stoloniferum]
MSPAPLPVVSSRNTDDNEAECPVCLEPLSFSFRLPGEKPHVVPECGHALHQACFVAVYETTPGSRASNNTPRKTNLGVCGVCRRPMKVGDGDSGKSNKLAALTGMGERNTAAIYPGRGQQQTAASPTPYDPNEDDPLDPTGSIRSGNSQHSKPTPYIIAPSIQVKPEFSSLIRTSDPTQPLTCIVTIELPSRRTHSHIPGPVVDSQYQRAPSSDRSDATVTSTRHRPVSTDSISSAPYAAYNATPAPVQDSPFTSITEDLRARIIDWKGHPLAGLGPLQMFDLLSVRRDSLVREFYVYLFKEAIICVIEERKRSLGRLLSGDSSGTGVQQTKGVLRLKGRIYIRHIKQVTETSASGELSLTIDMEDERLESFILIFRNRSSLETWRAHIAGLVASYHAPTPSEFGGKAQRMLSGSTAGTGSDGTSQTDSLLAQGSSRSTMSSSTSHNTHTHTHTYTPPLVTPHLSSGPSNSLPALPHTPLDLILVVSLPPPTASQSTAALKNRVIKTALDFVFASLGGKDRVSLVTFQVGMGGQVRRTPFLCPARKRGSERLVRFVDGIGASANPGDGGQEDEFVVRTPREEKTDVVTAVNHALDVVLQRKARNAISGMMLVSDAADSTRRAQMDLVLARAEAANVPIHSFGYGRSHDPASLWLMSNHTSGTYTFVKDWYDLRDCLAGCIGGMMSIGLLNMKLHMKVVDGRRFRIRKVSGGPACIVASDGHDVDVDVGELRYGEKKEMLVELELDNGVDGGKNNNGKGVEGSNGHRNATEQYVASMGLDIGGGDDMATLVQGMMDGMIDEVPVFEVDGSFYDPAACKQVSRLAHPVLLTVTLLPPSVRLQQQQQQQQSVAASETSDAVIVRRRMELLASDMITRALVLVSRKNSPQAQKILSETKRILHTVLQTITQRLPPPLSSPGSGSSPHRNRKEALTMSAVRALQSILADIQVLSEALAENVELFAHDQRNFGAQQAMILRDQKSWSGRTPTEKLFWTTDNSIELVSRSTDWVPREQ